MPALPSLEANAELWDDEVVEAATAAENWASTVAASAEALVARAKAGAAKAAVAAKTSEEAAAAVEETEAAADAAEKIMEDAEADDQEDTPLSARADDIDAARTARAAAHAAAYAAVTKSAEAAAAAAEQLASEATASAEAASETRQRGEALQPKLLRCVFSRPADLGLLLCPVDKSAAACSGVGGGALRVVAYAPAGRRAQRTWSERAAGTKVRYGVYVNIR